MKSREPKDKKYVQFINSLDLGVAMVSDKELKPIGEDFGFSKIAIIALEVATKVPFNI